MREHPTHLTVNREKVFTHGPSASLALVDVETYPAFVGKGADHLDMLAHMSTQMQALTAVTWTSPERALSLHFLVIEGGRPVSEVAPFHYTATASGWVRTSGSLCFTDQEHLQHCARDRSIDLLNGAGLSKAFRPRVLEVPPGIYSVLILDQSPDSKGAVDPSRAQAKVHYSVLLRHYPFPAPRLVPVRLPGFTLGKPAAEESETVERRSYGW